MCSRYRQKKWEAKMIENYTSLILDILTKTDYIGPFNQFCECFLEELFELLPHISSYDMIVDDGTSFKRSRCLLR